MRHASALYATGKTGSAIIIKNFFTSCTFGGTAYPDGLDYNNGYPLLGPNAASSVKPEQSYKNIFLVQPAQMEVGEATVPASYGAFYNGGWYGDPGYWADFKGVNGSEAYQADEAQASEGGKKLTFTSAGVFPVEATIISDSNEVIVFQFPVVVKGPSVFTIAATAGTNGSIYPSGEIEVVAGTDKAFTFTPDAGYQVANVLVDGNNIAGKPSSYEFTDVTSSHTIAVQFEPIQYSITYDLGGGIVGTTNPTTYTIETPSFTLNNPTRDGYTFLGWTRDGVTTPSTTVVIPAGTTGNLHFTAQWQENGSGGSVDYDYTLRYETNGGEKISSETKGYSWTKKYGELPVPVRKGYTFEGWYLDRSLTEPVTDDIKVNRSTVTLYAKWSADLTGPGYNGISGWLNTEDHSAYLNGYEDGSFRPDNYITRGEVAQLFYNLLLDKNIPITTSFDDVADDAWYAKAVNTLASLGILQGVGDDQFAPERPITRAEFTALAMQFTRGDTTTWSSFTDVDVNDWFYEQVAGAVQYGWITGYEDGTFRPNKPITRAEVATIVNRMLGRSADEQYVDEHVEALRRFPDVTDSNWAYYSIVEATNSHDYMMNGKSETWTDIRNP